jgi:hypothetical protein
MAKIKDDRCGWKQDSVSNIANRSGQVFFPLPSLVIFDWKRRTYMDWIHRLWRWVSVPKRQLLIAVVIFVLFGICHAWDEHLRDLVIPTNFGVVEDGQIYRSGQLAPTLIKKVLLKHNIKAIVSLSGDTSEAERKTAEELGIERKIFSLRGDGTGNVNDYARSIAAIYQFQKEGKPVLIHCRSGAHRTGAVIAAYRLIVQKKDIHSVRAEMIHYGFDPDGDTRLRIFLNNNMMKIAEELKNMGVIDEMPSISLEIKG